MIELVLVQKDIKMSIIEYFNDMVKFYFKIIFQDDSFGYEHFRATDKLEAYAKLRDLYPDAKNFIKLDYEEYKKEIDNLA